LFLSDSGHNRILQLNAAGQVLAVIGNGQRGFSNGNYTEATFNEPHGLALKGDILYVADTKNNAIRLVDLMEKSVTTVAGTGELDYYFYEEKWDQPVNPNSPWDLLINEDTMYIASAGNHQILKMDLRTEVVTRFAGTGREALSNGPLKEASFNQPSGLARKDNHLFIADAEASAIRCLDLTTGQVTTEIGWGLFHFGDQDGAADVALLQHAVGITVIDSTLFIADTYNGKIKTLDLEKKRVKTIVAGLEEPNDVAFIQGYLWITDTHHHQLLKVNLETGEKYLVPISFK
jgi:DNA-binding beta-propeller fold protein YncE